MKLTRRDFVRVTSLSAAATLAAACAQPAPTAAPAPTTAAAQPTAAAAPTAPPVVGPSGGATAVPTAVPTIEASKYTEAPMLAELVAKGELPPVEERLPANPSIAPVQEGIGKLGGMIRRGYQGVSDRTGPSKAQETSLTWFNIDLTMRADMAESWETNEDTSVWTFHLREGTKWSDGTPFTSAAFSWYWEHVLLNKELTPSPPRNWSAGNPLVLAELETPDDFTVIFKFSQPNPLFAYRPSRSQPFVPGHYLEQFHIDFADAAALEKATKDAGFNSWNEYYSNMADWSMNKDRPTTNPWYTTGRLGDELFQMVRNPYFWQVDPAGQQLPYLDRIQHRLYEQTDVFNMWIINGEIDFQRRGVLIGNYTLFKENEEKAGYKVFLSPQSTCLALHCNMTTKNERLREFFQTRDVRIAMSHAINREEINDLIFDGMAVPRQYSPDEGSPQFYPKLSNAYLEYDPDKANELLDAAGYTEKDAEGYRVWPGTNEAISFTFEHHTQPGDPNEDAAQMVSTYLQAVGIKATYKYFERSLYTQHYEANELEAAWAGGDRSILPIVTPWIFLGTQTDRPWAGAWGLWRNTNGGDPNGEEPPEGHWIRDIWALGDQVDVEPDDQKRNELFFKILDIWAEELPAIGVLGMFPSPCIVKNGFKGFLAGRPSDDLTKDEWLQMSQTYYWENPEEHM